FSKVVELLRFRTRQVQHAVDAIVWSILGNRDYVIRRFWLDEAHPGFNRSALLQTLHVADELNREPNKLAIACDLTTFMRVGDLVVLDLMHQETPVTFAEVKSGHVNSKCLDLLEQYHARPCPRFLSYELEAFSSSERKQF